MSHVVKNRRGQKQIYFAAENKKPPELISEGWQQVIVINNN